MKKISIILILSILMGMISMPSFAANKNMIVNPSFDKDVSGWTARNGATVTWDPNGFSGGCAKVKLNAGFSAIVQNVAFKAGNTYDISFYIRTEDAPETVTVIQNYSGGAGGWTYLMRDEPITSSWKKVSLTYACTGYNSKGGEVDGAGIFEIRIGDGQTKITHYLDTVTVTQRANDDDEEEAPEPTATPEPTAVPNKGVSEVSFSDINGHWAEQIIYALAANDLVDGFTDGTYAPEGEITRAEFTKQMVSLFHLDRSTYKNIYKDVAQGSWYADYIQTAYDIGLINRSITFNGKFEPDKPITRQEAATIIYNTFSKKNYKAKTTNAADYTDAEAIAFWAAGSVKGATEAGLLSGYEDGSFRPENTVTRAEAAAILANMQDLESRIVIFADSENGDDSGDGSISRPLQSFSAAKAMAGANASDMKNNMYVFLKGGEYNIDTTENFSAADSGTNGYNIIYTSYGAGQAKLSGGKHITGFTAYNRDKNIYRAKVDKSIDSRQMFVNGVRAVRARSTTGLTACTTDNGEVGHTTSDTFLADYKHPEDLEMVYYEQWTNPRCGVSSISVKDGVATLTMDQPGWKSVRNKGGTSVTNPVYYENALELLDEPGEWYLDTHEGYLYYMPRAFENIDAADIVLPTTEKLIYLQGSAEEPVSNIKFRNIAFTYTTWMRPSTTNGHSDAQNDHIRQSGVAEMPDNSAVEIRNGRCIDFEECEFSKLGITALQIFGGVHDCTVNGNEFVDISGDAVSLGEPDLSNPNIWDPQEEKYMIRNNKITNNYIHSIGVDYKSSAAISAGFPKDTLIAHNEIYNTPYSGMHIGYGWDSKTTTALENCNIEANYIHDVMNDKIFDGGGIYLIGATAGTMEDPNMVQKNYLENIRNYYGALYPDEGTQFWKLTQNVIDLRDVPYWYGNGSNKGPSKWLHCWTTTIRNNQYIDNYSTTAENIFRGTSSVFEDAHVYPEADWPEEAEAVKNNAGLEEKYANKYKADIETVALGTSEYSAAAGEEFTIELKAYTRKKAAAQPDMKNVYLRSGDPEIAAVGENGKVTALKRGKTTIYVDVLIDNILKSFEVSLVVDDTLDSIKTNAKGIKLREGVSYKIKATASSAFGRTLADAEISAAVADTSIASAEGMTVTGLAKGETTVKITAVSGGKTVEKDISLTVLGKDDPDDFSGYDFSEELMNLPSWTTANNITKNKIENGMQVSTPGAMISYNDTEFMDELFNFDLKINATSGWPSICLRAKDSSLPYGKNDLYMITFGQGYLQLQRFNGGERTVIYGKVEGYTPLAGENVPCSFEYGKKYTVKLGARNENGGVRILVWIDDAKVIDYTDTDEKRLEEQGYFQIYCRSGNMELTSPTK